MQIQRHIYLQGPYFKLRKLPLHVLQTPAHAVPFTTYMYARLQTFRRIFGHIFPHPNTATRDLLAVCVYAHMQTFRRIFDLTGRNLASSTAAHFASVTSCVGANSSTTGASSLSHFVTASVDEMVLVWASEQSARVRASLHCGVDVAKSLHPELSYLRLCGGSNIGAVAGGGGRGSGSTRGGNTHTGNSNDDRSWNRGIGGKDGSGADVLSIRLAVDAKIRERGLGASCVACRHDMGEVAIGTPFGRLVVLKMPSGEQVVEVCACARHTMHLWMCFCTASCVEGYTNSTPLVRQNQRNNTCSTFLQRSDTYDGNFLTTDIHRDSGEDILCAGTVDIRGQYV
jgi:hypothetical protein